ncbi:uncharacterized protein MONBRDRAFT_10986 [Monosiga brevicollis MX1]|uniref:Uncharacterized protein n=1 Tax=Monosiga brevicollis TaxID=81824 RepID=A9V7V2_MONBE|nr:uncharacterized protein MONBRDRAFT_10986 [Monosiga brevicollis MX1]EDQ86369.1 predicted protein [Monosiga brevicollis MX1]|eukprot:XP_001748759.1 hypothetical protein [Monosiga brevicollis MX1]
MAFNRSRPGAEACWTRPLQQHATLTRLELPSRQLQCVPPALGACQRLRALDLKKNQLTDLPAELANLQEVYFICSLTRLDLNNNRLTNLPESLGTGACLFLTSVIAQGQACAHFVLFDRALACAYTTLSGSQRVCPSPYPKAIRCRSCLQDMPALRELSLRSNHIAVIPSWLWQHPTLRVLSLVDNRIGQLEADLLEARCLERVDLGLNRLALYVSRPCPVQ